MSATSEYYRSFASIYARPVSPTYERLAFGVADDPDVLALLEALPQIKRQANLVFAAARWLGCPLDDYNDFRRALLDNWPEIVKVIMARSTQTNEAARCATLLPVLDTIARPLALLEVGASAGLCLLPDKYSYRYRTDDGQLAAVDPAAGPSAAVLPCDFRGRGTPPTRVPDVVWRAGIDLNPLDAADPDQVAWLENLIWPGQDERRPRLRAAASIAAAEHPSIVRGDLVANLAAVAAQAPRDATLVVFHSAVMMYLSVEHRAAFVDAVQALDAVWLSNEGELIFPAHAAALPAGVEPGDRFILARDGVPVALAGPHGQSFEWLDTQLPA